mmetsp:Transcript_3652/g.7550  ORF Transcript_3652/g.7550 Transcript_3652/m.7550 type:complete len:117 (+) Transcript_3652:1379-1729(+)
MREETGTWKETETGFGSLSVFVSALLCGPKQEPRRAPTVSVSPQIFFRYYLLALLSVLSMREVHERRNAVKPQETNVRPFPPPTEMSLQTFSAEAGTSEMLTRLDPLAYRSPADRR